MSNVLHLEDWDTVDRLSFTAATKKFQSKEEKLKKKFEKLASKKNPSSTAKKTVINLSKVELDQATTEVLSKGLNFAMAPKRIPAEEVICGVEIAIRDLPKPEAEVIRQDVSSILRHSSPPDDKIGEASPETLKGEQRHSGSPGGQRECDGGHGGSRV